MISWSAFLALSEGPYGFSFEFSFILIGDEAFPIRRRSISLTGAAMSCCDNEIPIGKPAANERVDLSQSLLFCMTESLGVAEFRQLDFEFILSLECVILSCDLQSLCRIV